MVGGTGVSCDPTPGSAATLPVPGVSCDPTHKNSMEGLTFFTFIKGQLRPYLTSVKRILQVFALFRGHSGSRATFLLSNFSPPPLATHALRPYLTTFLLSNFPPPLATHAFNDSSFKYNIPFIKTFPPLGNPCFATLPDNIPFIKFSPPLAAHAFNDSSSSTTFLLSNFPPPLGNPCFATLPDNIPFIKFPPPPGNPCFQWFKFKYNIPFIKIFPPLGNPCFATLPDNIPFIKFSPPLATHAFNDSSSSTTFLLSKFPPPPEGENFPVIALDYQHRRSASALFLWLLASAKSWAKRCHGHTFVRFSYTVRWRGKLYM